MQGREQKKATGIEETLVCNEKKGMRRDDPCETTMDKEQKRLPKTIDETVG